MNNQTIPHGPARCGDAYWCIKVPPSVSQSREIYVYADDLTVTPTGDLLVRGGYRDGNGKIPDKAIVVLALAAGKWTAFYAASLMDGAAVAVQHWAGEVER